MNRIFYLVAVFAIASLACGVTAVPASVAIQPTAQKSLESAKIQGQISTQTPQTCYGIVTASSLNLRDAPDLKANPDGAGLVDGDIVRIIGTVGKWYKVETADGREGYAKADFISRPGCAK